YKMRSRIKGRGEHCLSFRDMYDLEIKLSASEEWDRMQKMANQLDAGASSVWLPPSMAGVVLSSSMLRGFNYADILRAFYKRFEPKNILLIRFKDLAEDTEGTVRRVFEFLGLDPNVELPDLKTIHPQDVMDIELEK
ncbi:unnamed protein product, partial [Symbiodinium pilosum]